MGRERGRDRRRGEGERDRMGLRRGKRGEGGWRRSGGEGETERRSGRGAALDRKE
jgi:hypothetical protein